MIWNTKTSRDIRCQPDPATGTYADGLFPILAALELERDARRNFRQSYGRDYSAATESASLELSAR
jgi:hypothetical protein